MTSPASTVHDNPPGSTVAEDGWVIPGTVGRMPARCPHQGASTVPQHVEARTGQAGHQRPS